MKVPYRIIQSGRVLAQVNNLREAHRRAIHSSATTGRDVTIWQGTRKVLTYFGWKGSAK